MRLENMVDAATIYFNKTFSISTLGYTSPNCLCTPPQTKPSLQSSQAIWAGVAKSTYEEFFKSALEKWGVSEPDQLDDEEKSKFFNYVDANWSGENETD